MQRGTACLINCEGWSEQLPSNTRPLKRSGINRKKTWRHDRFSEKQFGQSPKPGCIQNALYFQGGKSKMTNVSEECAWSPGRWYRASHMFSKFQCWLFGALYQDTIGQDRPYWILIRREVLSIFLERYDKISLWTFKEFIIFTSFEIPPWLLDFFVAVKTVGVGRSSLLYSRGCFNPRVHINSTRNICGVHFSESSLKICIIPYLLVV